MSDGVTATPFGLGHRKRPASVETSNENRSFLCEIRMDFRWRPHAPYATRDNLSLNDRNHTRSFHACRPRAGIPARPESSSVEDSRSR